MKQLPHNNQLPINLLAACFNNTSATYKYYWLLAILQSLEVDKNRILKKELFARMISNAWFTVNYFHISFGKQDKLQRAIELIKGYEKLTINQDRDEIYNRLLNTNNKKTLSELFYFNNQVPHWFLSPWFRGMERHEIYNASQQFSENCLYALFNDEILINPIWVDYLKDNIRLISDFCYWNLSVYLQSKNPNVPDVPNKLIKPAVRNSLVKQRKDFWDIVLNEVGSINCIYTGKVLETGNYAVEHFVPFSFVSHDLIWNLIPADKIFNSSKSDKLPAMEKYFSAFFKLQKQAIEVITIKSPKNKFLEDYLTIFHDLDDIKRLPQKLTEEKFRERIQPLITIASNNGFEFL